MSAQSVGARMLSQRRGNTDGGAIAFGITSTIWALALGSLAFRLYRDATRPGVFDDLLPVWEGVRHFLNHQPVYVLQGDLHNYLYPPSSLIILSPIGFVDYSHLKVPMLVLEAVAIYAAALLSLRVVGIRISLRTAGLVLLGITVFEPARSLLDVKNVDSLMVLVEVVALLAMSRGRWILGGTMLGVAISIKPAIGILILLPLLFGKWRSAGASLAVGASLNLIAAGLGKDSLSFLTTTLPYLVSGQAPLHAWNISLSGATQLLGLPPVIAVVLRLLTIGIIVALLFRTIRDARTLDEPLRIAQVSGFLLLATDLVFSYSFEHYLIYLLPFLASMLRREARFNRVLALAGLICITVPDVPGQVLHNATLFWAGRIAYTLGCLLLLAAFALRTTRETKSLPAPPVPKSVPVN